MTIPRWDKANLTYFFASATLRAFRPGPAGSGVMTPTRVATPTTGAALCPSRHALLPHPPVAAMLARIPPIDVPPAMQHLLKNALPFAIAASLGLTILPVRADSTSSASSAGSSASTSLGSSSASLGKSTDSSSSKERVAQGHYTIVDMAAVVGPKLATLAESHTQLARTSSEQLPKLTEGFHGFAKVTTERLDEIREVVSEIKKEVIK